jgi:hypothetical protein
MSGIAIWIQYITFNRLTGLNPGGAPLVFETNADISRMTAGMIVYGRACLIFATPIFNKVTMGKLRMFLLLENLRT